MKAPVSLGYVISVTLLALASGVLSYLTANPTFSVAALLIGIYALHLVSVRIVVSQYGVSGGSRQAARARAELREEQEQLELDRRELENRKAELEEKILAAEKQWEMLRQMIRERVSEGAPVPSDAVTKEQWSGGGSPTGRDSGSDQPPRIHGRW